MKTKIKLFISSVFLIISLFAILWLVLKFWTVIFTDKIVVVNNTEKNIFITPYGRKMDSKSTMFGDIGLPTYYFFKPPSFLSPINNSFEIKPHDTKTLWYDINEAYYGIDYILIFGVQDQFRVLRVRPEYDKENKFIISEGMITEEASPIVMKFIHENFKGFLNMLPDLLMIIGLFNIYYFFKLIKKLKAENKAKKNLVFS
jgi:hypothetical protein